MLDNIGEGGSGADYDGSFGIGLVEDGDTTKAFGVEAFGGNGGSDGGGGGGASKYAISGSGGSGVVVIRNSR